MGTMLPSKEHTVWMLKSDIKDALPKTMILVLSAFILRERLSAYCFTALRQLGITDSKTLIVAEAGNTRVPTLSSAKPTQSKLQAEKTSLIDEQYKLMVLCLPPLPVGVNSYR